MSSAEFTPGPWTICWSSLSGVRSQFHLTASPHGSCRPIVECRWKLDEGVAETEVLQANANLIAAAPELYEALEIVRDADEDSKRDGLPTIPKLVRKQIDAALSKARGESS